MSQNNNELDLPISSKERLVAFLLCGFLGIFGAHRFYAGRTISAVIMLILTILGWLTAFLGVGLVFIGIVSIWALIDFIIVLIGKFKDSNGYIIVNWTKPAR